MQGVTCSTLVSWVFFQGAALDENEEKAFYDSDLEERQEKMQDKPYIMDPDHRLLLRNTKPLLQSRNTAVSQIALHVESTHIWSEDKWCLALIVLESVWSTWTDRNIDPGFHQKKPKNICMWTISFAAEQNFLYNSFSISYTNITCTESTKT